MLVALCGIRGKIIGGVLWYIFTENVQLYRRVRIAVLTVIFNLLVFFICFMCIFATYSLLFLHILLIKAHVVALTL